MGAFVDLHDAEAVAEIAGAVGCKGKAHRLSRLAMAPSRAGGRPVRTAAALKRSFRAVTR